MTDATTHLTYEVAEPARPYHDRTSAQSAVQQASEMVEEWDYEADAHGYCHTRPMLIRLIEIAQAAGYEPQTLL